MKSTEVNQKFNSNKSICIVCVNYIADGTCKAYPKGIPNKFFHSLKNHSTVEGDQRENFVFKKVGEN